MFTLLGDINDENFPKKIHELFGLFIVVVSVAL